jgi:hypothetical protein
MLQHPAGCDQPYEQVGSNPSDGERLSGCQGVYLCHCQNLRQRLPPEDSHGYVVPVCHTANAPPFLSHLEQLSSPGTDSEGVASACTGTYSKGAVLRCPVRDRLLGHLHWGTEGGGDEELAPARAHEQTIGMGRVEEPESSQ